MTRILYAALGISAPFAVMAQDTPSDPPIVAEQPASAEQAEIDRINRNFQNEYTSIENRASDLQNKGDICATGTAKWDVTTTSFDVPQVTMKTRSFGFDTIKTSFRDRGFSFDLPECVWKTMKIAFGIKTKFLKCGIRRHEFSTKIPEFKKDRIDFSFNIPEFRKNRVTWKYHILKIMSVDSISAPCKDLEKESLEIQGVTENMSKRHMAELNPVLRKQIQVRLAEMSQSAASVDQDMATALAEMDRSILELTKTGQNPAAIMTDLDGEQVSLVEARARIAKQRADFQTLVGQQQSEMETRLVELDQALMA